MLLLLRQSKHTKAVNMGITRQEIARILIEDMKWSDPKWSKRTGVTRQTFWRLRKQDYANIESKTLELMATAAGKKLEWNDMSKMEANIVDEAFKFDGSEVTVSALTQLLIESQQTAIELLKKDNDHLRTELARWQQSHD